MKGESPSTPYLTRIITAVIFVGVVGGGLWVVGGGKEASDVSGASAGVSEISRNSVIRERLYIGVRVRDGQDRLYELVPSSSVREVAVEPEWRADLLQSPSEVRVESRGTDGFAVMADEGWNVFLRSSQGRLYAAPQVVGLLDATHAVVVAKGERLEALRVAKNGTVSSLQLLPDTSLAYVVGDGALWYATFVQGEGLESEPLGPSEVWRVGAGGEAATVATSSRVVETILPGREGGVAFAAGRDVTVVFPDLGRWQGQGRPLLWLDAHRLLLADHGVVRMVSQGEVIEQTLGEVPGEVISAAQITSLETARVLQ